MERRISARQPIRCQIEGKAGHQSFVAEGFDMSETGLAFNTPQQLPQNAEVVLHYRLDEDGPWITAKVVICQKTEGRYGARFVERKTGKASGE
jgi:PilZ domain